MSLFGKVKQALGIGTVSVELQVPGQVSRDSREIQGQAVLTAKSAQKVKEIQLRFVEAYTTGRGQEQRTKEYELGALTLNGSFELQEGESKTVEFTLPFSLQLSSNQSLAQEGGVLGVLGKAAVMARSEKSEYSVRVEVKLEGTVLSPSDKKDIRLI